MGIWGHRWNVSAKTLANLNKHENIITFWILNFQNIKVLNIIAIWLILFPIINLLHKITLNIIMKCYNEIWIQLFFNAAKMFKG